MSDASYIAYQGIAGAYSHLACRSAYPDLEPLSCDTFRAAFRSVEEGRAELAMIPIDNTLGGRVADIHHLLPESSLYIIAEHFQPVRHALLGPESATLDSLKTVASHEQGLAQCQELIAELGVEPLDFGDTAAAAMEAAQRDDPTFGAIASELAAEIYGLTILRQRIEDRLGNTTRFVVLSRRAVEPDPRSGEAMTSLVFRVRSVPGALYKAMGGFATNGVNITKLESYMVDQRFTVAQFYVEIEGHPADPAVSRALDELQFFCTRLKRIGTFPKSEFREGQ